MNLKKRWAISLVSLLTFFSIGTTAYAATSNANITFTPGEGAPDVLDPSDPTIPYEPDPNNPSDPQESATGNTGPLTLDYVSSVNFGSQPIQAGTATYESTTLRPFIQVTDRRGTGAGWNVTAELSDFSNGEEESLPGAVIRFTGGDVVTSSATSNASPTPNDEVVLTAGAGENNVVSAAETTGLGSWITRWFPDEDRTDEGLNNNVTLEIPAGVATQGNHTATITWTLTAGPGQDPTEEVENSNGNVMDASEDLIE